jgi:hypothetical protein
MLNAACSKRRATPLAAAVEKPDFGKTKLGRGVPSLNGIGERDRGSQTPSSNRSAAIWPQIAAASQCARHIALAALNF